MNLLSLLRTSAFQLWRRIKVTADVLRVLHFSKLGILLTVELHFELHLELGQ